MTSNSLHARSTTTALLSLLATFLKSSLSRFPVPVFPLLGCAPPVGELAPRTRRTIPSQINMRGAS